MSLLRLQTIVMPISLKSQLLKTLLFFIFFTYQVLFSFGPDYLYAALINIPYTSPSFQCCNSSKTSFDVDLTELIINHFEVGIACIGKRFNDRFDFNL